MTAALYRLPEGTLPGAGVGAIVALDGDEGHHAVTVKRTEVGEEVLLADGSGLVARGVVVAVAAGRADVRLLSVEEEGHAGPRFVLVQALAKGGRDEQALEAATELGVDAVLAWQAARCIVRWKADRAAKSLDKWRGVAGAAAKQSRRATTPQVEGPFSTADLVRRLRGEGSPRGGFAGVGVGVGARDDGEAAPATVLVLHEDAHEPLAGVTLPEEGEVWLLVGPEGGIAPEELDALAEAGARCVRLGSTVLRSSSAGPAALAVLNAMGRWR